MFIDSFICDWSAPAANSQQLSLPLELLTWVIEAEVGTEAEHAHQGEGHHSVDEALE
jgi:hypothetical protein